ncbi:hypothetical protein C4D60_Mb02t06450 [Musa balbisiana]|uniref:Uncharacterized protein n=1 Tax=Musa balbisiana TaxID=52838 RepID=A0A4S8I8Q1_MUSBA|nr:hypothetical protein C4D60_Mb02t06450 [Musa balbisiana]
MPACSNSSARNFSISKISSVIFLATIAASSFSFISLANLLASFNSSRVWVFSCSAEANCSLALFKSSSMASNFACSSEPFEVRFGVVLFLISGLDSADFGDRSSKERDFGTGEDGFATDGDTFGTGEDGFCAGEGEPESDLVDPFLGTLLTLGVADVVLPFEASDRPDLR